MDYIHIIIAVFAQFVLGALWYSPLLFGKTWMKIMEVDKYSQEEIKEMQKKMMPFYLLQICLTFVFTFVLALFLENMPSPASYLLSLFVFFGFIVPTQISGVIWGNTKREFWLKQILIMMGCQLVGIIIATSILSF